MGSQNRAVCALRLPHSTTAHGLQLIIMAARACNVRWLLLQQLCVCSERSPAVQQRPHLPHHMQLARRPPAMTLYAWARPALFVQDLCGLSDIVAAKCADHAAIVVCCPLPLVSYSKKVDYGILWRGACEIETLPRP